MAVSRIVTCAEVARRHLGLTKLALSQDPAVLMDVKLISMLESGRYNPTEGQRLRLSLRLGLHPDDLLKPAVTLGELVERHTEAVTQ